MSVGNFQIVTQEKLVINDLLNLVFSTITEGGMFGYQTLGNKESEILH